MGDLVGVLNVSPSGTPPRVGVTCTLLSGCDPFCFNGFFLANSIPSGVALVGPLVALAMGLGGVKLSDDRARTSFDGAEIGRGRSPFGIGGGERGWEALGCDFGAASEERVG